MNSKPLDDFVSKIQAIEARSFAHITTGKIISKDGLIAQVQLAGDSTKTPVRLCREISSKAVYILVIYENGQYFGVGSL